MATHSVDAQFAPKEIKSKIVSVKTNMTRFCDSVTSRLQTNNDSDQIISDGSYKRYIDQYFTYLSYNRGALPSGTSAALELTSNSTQIDLSIARKFEPDNPRGPITILTGGVKAKINDGISQLFSGGNISSGTTLFSNFTFLPARSKYKKNISAEIIRFDENGDTIPTPFQELKAKRAEYNTYFCQNSTQNYEAKYNSLLNCWSDIQNQLSQLSVDCDITELLKKKEDIEKKLENAGLLALPPAKIANALKKEYTDKMYDLEAESDAWLWVKFFWWSGGIIYTRQSYDTYDEKNSLAKRFDSKDFDEVGIKITANWFKQKLNNSSFIGSSYFNISYEPKTTNSYLVLKNQDIFREISRSPSPADTVYSFQTTKKAKNITNKQYKTGWQHKFSGTYTAMLGKKQKTGINLRGEWIASQLSAPIYSIHFGALLRFVNNNYDPTDKKSNAKVNFEIFIEFIDMTDVGNSRKSVWQNKVIGVNTTVPFNKIFFK